MKYTAGSSDDCNKSYYDGCVEELCAEPAKEEYGVDGSKEMGTRGGRIPCYGSQLKYVVVRSLDEDAYCGEDAAVGNNLKQKRAYRPNTFEWCGFMSKRRQVVLPICVMAGIRDRGPNK